MITDPNEVETGTMVEFTYNERSKYTDDEQITVSRPGKIVDIDENTLTIENRKQTLEIDLTEQSIVITDHNLFKSPPDRNYELKEVSDLTTEDIHFSLNEFSDENRSRASIDETLDRANETLDHITEELGKQWLLDHSWISTHDVIKSDDIRVGGVEEVIDRRNDNITEDAPTITFSSETEVIIWTQEILGQISDGAWENANIDWRYYYDLKIELDKTNDALTVESPFPDQLNFQEKIEEFDGMVARMIFFAMVAQQGVEISLNDIQETLRQLDKNTV